MNIYLEKSLQTAENWQITQNPEKQWRNVYYNCLNTSMMLSFLEDSLVSNLDNKIFSSNNYHEVDKKIDRLFIKC